MKAFFKWGWTERRGKVTFRTLLMPMWQCSSEFPTITWRAQAVPCWAMRTEHGGGFAGNHPLPIYNCIKWKQLLLAKTILINAQLMRAQKDNFVFFVLTNFIPYTIFIKVHLSAISLPRKQLSIENSACFLFLLFFLSLVWFLCPSRYSM